MFKDFCFAVLFLVIGNVMGMLLLVRWWGRQLRKPEVLENFFRGLMVTCSPEAVSRIKQILSKESPSP